MYTGIVQAMLPVKTWELKPGLATFSVEFPASLLDGLETGASVAVNGVCFTVTGIKGREVSFDAIAQTLALSNIGDLQAGTAVNIERSAKAGAEVGGHVLSGHVIDIATVVRMEETENNRGITFKGDPAWMKFVFNKGFLALNGCSLTVAAVDHSDHSFRVNLIPETLTRTNFALLSQGSRVNVEIDHQTQVIVETVERVMHERFT
ncbi:MAG: riboflavin synthase subunit alpha [Pseudomonadales bacterium]